MEYFILFIYFILIYFITKLFLKITDTPNIWEKIFIYILIFSSFFPFIERYFAFSIRIGVIKALLIFCFLSIYFCNKITSKQYKVNKDIIIYFVFYGVFLLFLLKEILNRNINFTEKLRIITSYGYYPLISFFSYNEIDDYNKIKNIMKIILCISIIMSLVGFIEWLSGPYILYKTGMTIVMENQSLMPFIKRVEGKPFELSDIDYFRIFSTLTDHQAYAAFLVLGFLSLVFLSKKMDAKFVILIYAGLIFSLLTTYSLTAIIGIVLILTIFYFIMKVLEKESLRYYLIFIFLLLSYIMIFNDFRSGLLNSDRLRIVSRLKYFENAVKLIKIKSSGYNVQVEKINHKTNVDGISVKIYDKKGNIQKIKISSDSYWTWFICQFGVLPFIFYLMIYLFPLFILLKNTIKLRSEVENYRFWVLLAVFMSINIVYFNFSNNLMKTGPSNLVFWFLTGVAMNKYLFMKV